jgi:hypothetical protein
MVLPNGMQEIAHWRAQPYIRPPPPPPSAKKAAVLSMAPGFHASARDTSINVEQDNPPADERKRGNDEVNSDKEESSKRLKR